MPLLFSKKISRCLEYNLLQVKIFSLILMCLIINYHIVNSRFSLAFSLLVDSTNYFLFVKNWFLEKDFGVITCFSFFFKKKQNKKENLYNSLFRKNMFAKIKFEFEVRLPIKNVRWWIITPLLTRICTIYTKQIKIIITIN